MQFPISGHENGSSLAFNSITNVRAENALQIGDSQQYISLEHLYREFNLVNQRFFFCFTKRKTQPPTLAATGRTILFRSIEKSRRVAMSH